MWKTCNHCELPAKLWATMIYLFNGIEFWFEKIEERFILEEEKDIRTE